MMSKKKMCATSLIACIVSLSAFFACNKRETPGSIAGNSETFFTYDGTDQQVIAAINQFRRITDSSLLDLQSGKVLWNRASLASSTALAKTSGTMLFPVIQLDSTLAGYLSIHIDSAGNLNTPLAFSYKRDFYMTMNPIKKQQVSQTLAALALQGCREPDKSKLYRSFMQKQLANTARTIKRNDAQVADGSSCGGTVAVYFTLSLYSDGACMAMREEYVYDLSNYIIGNLPNAIQTIYQQSVTVMIAPGQGFTISGPTALMENILSAAVLSPIIASIIDSYTPYGGCMAYPPSLSYVEILGSSCGGGGDNSGGGTGGDTGGNNTPPDTPVPDACTTKSGEEALNELSYAMTNFTRDNEIIPNPDLAMDYVDFTGYPSKKEAPQWEFFTAKFLGAFTAKYSAFFKSDKSYIAGQWKWKTFEFDNKVTLTSGAVPPCVEADMQVNGVACNITPDALTATATLKYTYKVAVACVFGWQVGSESSDPYVEQTFEAFRNY